MPKFGSNHTCLGAINIDYALKEDENPCLKVFLKRMQRNEKKPDD